MMARLRKLASAILRIWRAACVLTAHHSELFSDSTALIHCCHLIEWLMRLMA